jgi:hypothetical protein
LRSARSQANVHISVAVNLEDRFPFDRTLIEVPFLSTSPGLWPDNLDHYLQLETVLFTQTGQEAILRIGRGADNLSSGFRAREPRVPRFCPFRS